MLPADVVLLSVALLPRLVSWLFAGEFAMGELERWCRRRVCGRAAVSSPSWLRVGAALMEGVMRTLLAWQAGTGGVVDLVAMLLVGVVSRRLAEAEYCTYP